ncbi:MAG: carbonic anhydrase [Alphaproteobacteria bacterium]|nr:carbonic anhydrase [Alphaproteobacteria bacterium]
MDDLIKGYRRFRAGTWANQRARFDELSRSGQRPNTLLIACSDSRADPQMIFDVAPGELFVVRNVANLIPPYGPDSKYHGTSSALEFGVRVLKVEHLVVMGHAMCGGIHALLHGAPEEASDFVANWVNLAERAKLRALQFPPDKRQDYCEHESVRLSLENLMTFPWVHDPVADGKLKLHGCFFDIRSGLLERLGDDGSFHPVDDGA